MKTSSSPSTLAKQLAARVRTESDNLLTRWADVIKDMLLDWDISPEPEDGAPVAEELPPMSADEFVYALRGRIEETLHRIADVINRAPTGQIVAASEEQVCGFLAELYASALELGVQMRLEAHASPADLPRTRANGEWAKRLRRMMAGGSDMPVHNG